MAGASRTLKLSILADVDQLNKSLKAANNDVETSSNKISDFGKKAGLAFAAAAAAAGAYAIKIGVEGVKAAIEDEKSQNQLAIALEKATGATEAQIRATEGQISQMSLAFGIADDKLRPAMSRLALATGDQSKAQDLLTLAMDLSTATGKPLESVSNALAKAYEGNTGALGKLGVGLNKAELASMSMDQITTTLSNTFAGSATDAANTFDGRISRIKVGLDEAKESIGAALLPTVGRLIDYINREVVPAFNAFALGLNDPTGGPSMTEGFTDTQLAAYNFGITVRDLGGQVQKLFNVFNSDANTGNTSGLARLIGWMNTILNAVAKVVEVAGYGLALLSTLFEDPFASFEEIQLSIQAKTGVISGRNKAKMGEQVGYVGSMMVGGGYTPTAAKAAPSGVGIFGGGSGGVSANAGGGVSTAAKSGAEAAIKLSPEVARVGMLGGLEAGVIAGVTGRGQNASVAQVGMLGGLGAGVVAGVNITVNQGIVGDQESAARAVVDVLNSSFYRGTGGASALVAL